MTLLPFLPHRDLPAVCFCLYLVCHSNSNGISRSTNNRSSSITIIKTSHRFCCFCWKMTLQIFVIEARKTAIDIQSCGFISSLQGFQCIHNMKSTCASSLSTFNLLNLNNIEHNHWLKMNNENKTDEWRKNIEKNCELLCTFNQKIWMQNAECWCGCHNRFLFKQSTQSRLSDWLWCLVQIVLFDGKSLKQSMCSFEDE